MTRPRLVAAPDKFRGTATAADLARVAAEVAREENWDAETMPVSDGGEGLLECFGGGNRTTTVTGPDGAPVAARWRLDGTRAVIAMAEASGLALVRGRNDAAAASSRGTGELVAAAIAAGARDVVLGAGGSASTDGGAAAVDLLEAHAPFDGRGPVRVVIAADVTTRFVDAAEVFAPQKGATPEQVTELTARLRDLAHRYRERFGVDIETLPGSGAAGGFAGGLAALGASIRPGFDVVAEQTGLAGRVAGADLVVTGEGRLDRTSLLGKAPLRVARLAADHSVACLLIAGDVDPAVNRDDLPDGLEVVSLTGSFGDEPARSDTLRCVGDVVREVLHRRRG